MPRPALSIRRWLLWATLGIIALATLGPGIRIPDCSPWAFFCDEFRGADTIGNVLLFLPLGLALGGGGSPTTWRYLVPLAIGATIELLQSTPWISRDPSLRDALANGLGGAIGVWVGSHWSRIVRPTRSEAGRWFWTWLVGLTMALAGGAAILQPSIPRSLWYGQWTAELGQFDRFPGTLIDARLGAEPVPSGPIARTEALRSEAARTGYSLVASVDAAPGSTDRVAPALSMFDDASRLLTLIGRWRDDLAYGARLAAQDHGFYPIWFRVPGAFRRVPARIRIEGRLQAGRFEGSWRSSTGEEGAGRESIGPIDGWRAVLPAELVIPLPSSLISAGLLFALVIPLGYLGSSQGRFEMRAVATAIPLAIALCPLPLGLAIAPAGEWIAAAAGFLVGWMARRQIRLDSSRANERST